jgi:hypothetical protein
VVIPARISCSPTFDLAQSLRCLWWSFQHRLLTLLQLWYWIFYQHCVRRHK